MECAPKQQTLQEHCWDPFLHSRLSKGWLRVPVGLGSHAKGSGGLWGFYHLNYSLNSLKGGSIEEYIYIGEYYRGY